MNQKHFIAIGAAVFVGFAANTASAGNHKYLNFDVPGGKGTLPFSINDKNDVIGFYTKHRQDHGFLRTSDGAIATFDAPQASSTYPLALNNGAETTGYFYDSSSVTHGFLRTPDGTITTIDVPDSKSTFPDGINDEGDIVGTFKGQDGSDHAFLRKSTGEFVSFDPEGSFGTVAISINNDGMIAGFFCSTFCGSENKGFVRSVDGTITTIAVKDAKRTEPSSVNAKGEIAGRYFDCCGLAHGFVRRPNGQIALFECSFVPELNDQGWAVGATATNEIYHGCLRAPDGTVSEFDDPKADDGIGGGTSPSSINIARYITGWYADSHGHYHGFIVRPPK